MGSKGREISIPRRLEFDEETLTDTYGKFYAGPFERGIATSIGNSLRRMLLSSLEGAAVISCRFDGVLHEFSTIKGVVEDASEIILNLKGLILKFDGPGPKTAYLKKEGEGEVKARDIEFPPGVEAINIDHHIAQLDEDGKLEMEMEIDKGYGYLPAERHKAISRPIGVIPMDAFFSPVVRVKYEIEDVRVGQITDYERLIMEIHTNGSINPRDALAKAASKLREYLGLFIHFEEPQEVEEEAEVDKERERLRQILNLPVEELELSVRSSNCLRAADITTLGELVMKTEQEMLKTRNFGKKSLAEIKEKLAQYNLTMGMKGIADLLEKGD
jgi:DNA-directed RNA polymerase subunit alpha